MPNITSLNGIVISLSERGRLDEDSRRKLGQILDLAKVVLDKENEPVTLPNLARVTGIGAQAIGTYLRNNLTHRYHLRVEKGKAGRPPRGCVVSASQTKTGPP